MNLERIEAVIRLAAEAGLGELVIETEDWRIGLKTAGGPVTPPLEEAPPPVTEAERPSPAPVRIRARLVGIFRAASPPVESGAAVLAGQTVGHIESMRVLNPVTAETAGVVTEVLVEDGDPVEYGQELFILTPQPAEVTPAES